MTALCNPRVLVDGRGAARSEARTRAWAERSEDLLMRLKARLAADCFHATASMHVRPRGTSVRSNGWRCPSSSTSVSQLSESQSIGSPFSDGIPLLTFSLRRLLLAVGRSSASVPNGCGCAVSGSAVGQSAETRGRFPRALQSRPGGFDAVSSDEDASREFLYSVSTS